MGPERISRYDFIHAELQTYGPGHFGQLRVHPFCPLPVPPVFLGQKIGVIRSSFWSGIWIELETFPLNFRRTVEAFQGLFQMPLADVTEGTVYS